MAKVLWGSDLLKGATVKNSPGMMRLADFAPDQMMEESEKTKEWLIAVTDHFEAVGWRNVSKKGHRIQRNYWFRQGILNPTDYIHKPSQEQLNNAMAFVGLDTNSSPLQKFYPLIPTYVDLIRGEFIKRDNSFTVTQIDHGAVVEALQFKEEKIQENLKNLAIAAKSKSLSEMGITEDNPDAAKEYKQAIQKAISDFNETEAKFKKFRTEGAKWAERVIKIQEKKYNLIELEPEILESGLITDSAFVHLDLKEDDFELEMINPKYCDYHKGPNIKYVSDGDYFLWFDWGSIGDIINKFGKIMKEEEVAKLKTTYNSILNSIIVPDHEKTMQGSYYDARLPYEQAVNLNAPMNDAILGKELAFNFSENSNFSHSIFDSAGYNTLAGSGKMFRIMRLYFRGMKKIGWLTKIGEDGSLEYGDWVDENFKVSVKPVYDNSLVKEKTKKNLIFGEHIDWTWVNDWRHVIKISADTKHTFWKNNPNFTEIYLDGESVRFQFKGINNPYESKPPVEGCEFSWINAKPYGFVDRLESYQIMFNIAMNKIPRNMLDDKGMKISINQGTIPRNNLDIEAGVNPIEAFEENLDSSLLLPYNLTREQLDVGMGQPALPQLLNLSTVQTAQYYLQLAQQIKFESGEVVGITRNRMGQNKASETAYSVEQGVSYSESQTEKYFENHYNLMKRVRQRMLDAAQYYTTFKKSSQEMYLNSRLENEILKIEGMQNLMSHYQIHLESSAKNRALMNMLTNFLVQENTLPFKPAAKIKAIVTNSVTELLELVEKSELEEDLRLKEEREAEQQAQQQQQEAAQKDAEAQRAYLTERDDKMIQRDLDVARIRALGGIQTDVDKDGQMDAKENLDYELRKEQANNQNQVANKTLEQKQSQHEDNIFLQNKALDVKAANEKKKLDIALVNANKSTDKVLARNIAKKNK